MSDRWAAQTRNAIKAYDLAAEAYARDWGDELDRNPFDGEFFADFAKAVAARPELPVLEVGSGPAHPSRRLAASGHPTVATDASFGQLRQARLLQPSLPVAVADLARLPVRDGSLGAIVAFYCLIYGPADHLDVVFAEWHRAVAAGGVVTAAMHAGTGDKELHGEQDGIQWTLTLVLRDPEDVAARLRSHGFAIEKLVTRPPYPHEYAADHLLLTATRQP